MASAFRTDSKPYRLVADVIGNPPNRAERLKEVANLTTHFRAVKGDLVQLAGYINALLFKLALPDGPYLWPKRPSMLSLPKSTKRKQKGKR